jgi:WD40 repeat protein
MPTLHLNICRYRKINQHVNINRCSCSSCVLTLTSASLDNTVRLWAINPATGTGVAEETLTSFYNNSSFTDVAFSPDGKVLASASEDKTIWLWAINPATGTRVSERPLKGHKDRINAIAFSSDGKLLASASDDDTVRLWAINTATATTVFKLALEVNIRLNSLCFSEDGRYINTDRGLLQLSEPSAPVHYKDPWVVFVNEDWITLGEQDLLWLPPDYRMTCSVFYNNILVLGHASGRVTFLVLASS